MQLTLAKTMVLTVGALVTAPTPMSLKYKGRGNEKREFIVRFMGPFEDLIASVPHRPDADIVYISNERSLSLTALTKHCHELATLVKVHPNRPIVVLAMECGFLTVIFTRLGIRTRRVEHGEKAIDAWVRAAEERSI